MLFKGFFITGGELSYNLFLINGPGFADGNEVQTYDRLVVTVLNGK
jgi:hypothetical protein